MARQFFLAMPHSSWWCHTQPPRSKFSWWKVIFFSPWNHLLHFMSHCVRAAKFKSKFVAQLFAWKTSIFFVVRQSVSKVFIWHLKWKKRWFENLSVYWIQITDHGRSDDPHDRIWHKHGNDYLLDIWQRSDEDEIRKPDKLFGGPRLTTLYTFGC